LMNGIMGDIEGVLGFLFGKINWFDFNYHPYSTSHPKLHWFWTECPVCRALPGVV
jgi:hypothetical protein